MMHKKRTSILSLLLCAALVLSGTMLFADAKDSAKQLNKETALEIGYFDGNNIFTYLENDGTVVTDDYDGNSGMYWPSRASLQTINYASGVWVAGMIDGAPVTACAEFASEWLPGVILPDGTPDNFNASVHQLYKINKADMLDPEANEDWMNWPVQYGAPWVDVNENGVYEPLIDHPDMMGDQMIWYVMNDANPSGHTNLFNTIPIGIETRVTIWGYNRPDEFGDMLFVKFQLFNKLGNTVEDCYLGIWDDVDLGDSSDDYVGCDTTLDLGYTYNDGADGVYGAACPAIGYDFFQGALVEGEPGDSAKAFGQKWYGYKNLGMNTFAKYMNGGGATFGDPESPQECYNYMSGLARDGSYFDNNGVPVYPLRYGPGDPVAGTGWLDAQDHPSSDRRMLLTCGPFTLAAGDSQEVVAGMIIGAGSDHLASITRLKQSSIKAQVAYDIDFELPPPPDPPVATYTELDNRILIEWDDLQEEYEAIDKVDMDSLGNPTYYTFQGYNVYQLETDRGIGVKKRIATYDIVDLVQDIQDFVFVGSLGENVNHTVQYGSDTGIQRFHYVENDAVRANAALVNNRPYYFGVTAYGYNPDGVPKALEGSYNLLTVYPQDVVGEDENTEFGVEIEFDHTAGVADANAGIDIIDALAVKDGDYKFTFHRDTTWTTDTTYTLAEYWKLLRDGTVIGQDDNLTALNDNYVFDGVLPRVDASYEAPTILSDAKLIRMGEDSLETVTIVGTASQAIEVSDYGNEHWADTGWGLDFWGTGTTDLNVLQQDLEFRFTGEYEYVTNDSGQVLALIKEGTGSVATFLGARNYDVGDHPLNPNPGSEDYFTMRIPFEVWNVDANMQVNYMIYDRIQAADADTFYAFNPADRVYAMVGNTPYAEEIYDPDNDVDKGNACTWMNVFWHCTWEKDDIVQIKYDNPIFPGADEFSFTLSGYEKTEGVATAKADVDKINVFPNPYFGGQMEEIQPLDRFVRFTHLPDDSPATIRIFTLSGELVRVLEHDNGTQFEEWNLENDESIPVSSGMYIVHVDCGSLGEKILKMAVLMPEERLRQY